MTDAELEIIKEDPEEADTEITGSRNKLGDYVARQLLFMVVRFRKIAKIRIVNRI